MWGIYPAIAAYFNDGIRYGLWDTPRIMESNPDIIYTALMGDIYRR